MILRLDGDISMKTIKWWLLGAAFVSSLLFPVLYIYQANIERQFRIDNAMSMAWDFTRVHYIIAILIAIIIIVTFVLTAVKMAKQPNALRKRGKVVMVFKVLGVGIVLFAIYLYIAGFLGERYASTQPYYLYWFPYYMYGSICGAIGALLYLATLIVSRLSLSDRQI